MCTLVIGWQVLGSDTLLLAANRDEDPARPATGPMVLRRSPRVVGGRDQRAGGTWLAIRERRCVIAVLNRRNSRAEGASPAPPVPSRGWLVQAIAAAGDGEPAACARAARLLLRADPYAPCSLVIAGPRAVWVVNHRASGDTSVEAAGPGWHVITHEDLDDPSEPRTAWLAAELRGFAPPSVDAGLKRLDGLLAAHGGATPAVCLHQGRMRTVSTARVWMSGKNVQYLHGEGTACRAVWSDHSNLLDPS